MTHTELTGIVTHYLPANMGIVLAGSQRKNEVLSKTTDIDLVVLEVSFSHIQNFSLLHNGFKLDFTILPFTDIENILQNESNESKGGVLHMLNNGVVLKDNCNLFPIIQNKAALLISKIGGKVFADYQYNITSLSRNSKYLLKSLSKNQRTVLLCDIVSLISETESIKISNWASKQHKLSLCENEDPTLLCNELIEIFNRSLHTGDNTEISNLTNYYLQTAESLVSYPLSNTTRLLIDLDYPDFSVPDFLTSVLPFIKESEALNSSFSNFYLSPRHYHKTYKNRVTLVFKISNHSHAAQILKEAESVFDTVLKKGKRHSVIYQSNDQFSNEKFALFEQLRISVNSFIGNEVNAQKYSPIILVYDSMALGSYVCNYLRLSSKDIIKANSFLAQRSLLNPDEQRQISGFEQLRKVHEMKFQAAFSFYEQHKKAVLDYCNNGLLITLLDLESNKDAYSIIKAAITSIINDEGCFGDSASNLSFLALQQGQCEDVMGVFKYVTVMAEILQYFGISESEKFVLLLSLSRAISELKGESNAHLRN